MNIQDLEKQYKDLVGKWQHNFAQNAAWRWLTWTVIFNAIVSFIVAMTVESNFAKVVLFGLGYVPFTLALGVAVGMSLKSHKVWSWVVGIAAFIAVFFWNALVLAAIYFLLENDYVRFGNALLHIGAMMLCSLPMYFIGKDRGNAAYKAPFTQDEFVGAMQELLVKHDEARAHEYNLDVEADRFDAIFEVLKGLVPEEKMAEIKRQFPLWNELETKPVELEPYEPSVRRILMMVSVMRQKTSQPQPDATK
jgi:hypothetical protein